MTSACTFDFADRPGRSDHARFDIQAVCQKAPLISVITPVSATVACTEQLFHCLQNQTFPWFEWLLVTPADTPQALCAALQQWAEKDPRIRLLSSPDAAAAAKTRRAGALAAKSDCLVFLDTENLLEPPFLENVYLALQQTPAAAWAYTDAAVWGKEHYLWGKGAVAADRMAFSLPVMVRAAYFWQTDDPDADGSLWAQLQKAAQPLRLPLVLSWAHTAEQTPGAAEDRDPPMTDSDRAVLNKDVLAPLFSDIPVWEKRLALPFSQKKRRVLLLLPHMVMGGADKFNLDLIAGLDAAGFAVTIATTLPDSSDWRQRFAAWTDDIFELPYTLDKRDWPSFLDYLLCTRQIDLVFNTNSYFAYHVLPWLHLRYPSLPFVDYIHMEEWHYRYGGYARASGAVGVFLDKTYVCNEQTRQVLIKDFGRQPDSVQTVYIGVDEKQFDPATVDAKAAFAALPALSDARPVILFPCRICPQKRPFLMLEIARRLPEYQFVVVGDGPQLEELTRAVKKAGLEKTVLFAGRQDDPRPWYKAAAVTLICSLKEGLSLTAYESLAMCTPVVTSDVGGQAELVDASVGRVAPLLQDESADQDNRCYSDAEIQLYVDALLGLFACTEAEKAEMQARCRQKILDGFTVSAMQQTMTTELMALLDEQLTAQRRARIERYNALLPLMESHADLFCGYDLLEIAYHKQLGRLYQLIPDENELDRIHQMRSFQLAQRYQQLMQNNFLRTARYSVGWLKRRLRGERPAFSPPQKTAALSARPCPLPPFDYTLQPGLPPYCARPRKATPQQAKISIISGFYNAGKYFEQTYHCVMAQTFPWFEWVIVDDGSTDADDLRLLERLAATDDRIRVVHQPNGGLSAARNAAVAHSTTDIIVSLDTDDLIEPTFLECVYFSLLTNPAAAWAYTDSVGFGEQQYLWRRAFCVHTMKTENLLVEVAAIRKSTFDAIQGWKVEKHSYNEDWRFWLECLQKGFYPVHLASWLSWYRRTSSGMLSDVETDPEKIAANRRIIQAAAAPVSPLTRKVEYPAKAKSLPRPAFAATFSTLAPVAENAILLLLRQAADLPTVEAVCASASTLAAEGKTAVVVLERSPDAALALRLQRAVPDFFCLEDFLFPEDWKEFIQYLLYTRAPKTLLCERGVCCLPDKLPAGCRRRTIAGAISLQKMASKRR